MSFQPLRSSLHRAVTRPLYGERDDPHRIVAVYDGLGSQLASMGLTVAAVHTRRPGDPAIADRVLRDLGPASTGCRPLLEASS